MKICYVHFCQISLIYLATVGWGEMKNRRSDLCRANRYTSRISNIFCMISLKLGHGSALDQYFLVEPAQFIECSLLTIGILYFVKPFKTVLVFGQFASFHAISWLYQCHSFYSSSLCLAKTQKSLLCFSGSWQSNIFIQKVHNATFIGVGFFK